jgi:hypothetical protein
MIALLVGKDGRAMYRFHIEIPDDLWERFKTRAIQEHGSPRQAAMALFRDFINRPDSPKGEPHASDDDRQPPK